MNASLHLNCSLNNDRIPLTDQPRLVYLLIEVGVEGVAQSAAVNLNLVVDVSESMQIRLVTDEQFAHLASLGFIQEVMADGVPAWQAQNLPREVIEQFPRKVDFVIEALRIAFEQIRPQDQVSLVAFAHEAKLLLPPVSGQDKQKLTAAVEAFIQTNLGDDTFLGSGMTLGYTTMKPETNVAYVNRMVLLTDGFTRDVASCWQVMEQARQSGLTISTMGVGDEFNEDLLIPLAEQTGGRAYFIQNPDQIPPIFREELQGLQNVVCREAELKLQLTPGVELRQAYRVKPLISLLNPGANRGGSYNIPLGDIEEDAPPSLLLELIVPPRAPGRYRIAQLLLDSAPVGGHRQTTRQEIVIEQTPQVGPVNGYVMNVVERVTAFKLQTRALEDAAAGDIRGATRKLQAAATRLLDMGEADLAQAAQKQATLLDQQTQLDPQATKRLQYGTRKLTQTLP